MQFVGLVVDFAVGSSKQRERERERERQWAEFLNFFSK